MLVIDSTSSYCDVCLEVYSQERSPHALSCGHVFCQPCLESVASSQGIVAQDQVDWAAAARDPLFSINDIPRLAPCPLCRSPFTRHSTHRIQATYSKNVQMGDFRERSPESETTFATDEGSAESLGSNEEISHYNSSDSANSNSTRTAIKMNLEIQVSDIIFEGPGSASRDDIIALNHQIQEWLADEAQESRIEEHLLLRASIQLLMQSLRSR